MSNTLYVSLAQTFVPGELATLEDVKELARSDWRISVARARTCHRLIAVYDGQRLGAWEILDAYSTDTPWGKDKKRTALVLGQALPVFSDDFMPEDIPNLRNGCAVAA